MSEAPRKRPPIFCWPSTWLLLLAGAGYLGYHLYRLIFWTRQRRGESMAMGSHAHGGIAAEDLSAGGKKDWWVPRADHPELPCSARRATIP